jgi:hypothetical protein
MQLELRLAFSGVKYLLVAQAQHRPCTGCEQGVALGCLGSFTLDRGNDLEYPQLASVVVHQCTIPS